jgi:hypothetical protein
MDAEKPKCASRAKQTGKRCKRDPAIGLDKCAIHCGLSKAERDEVARRFLAEKEMAEAVKTYGLPRDIDPTDALLEEVHYTAGHVAWLRTQVQALEPAALVWGLKEQSDKGATEFPGTDTTHAAMVNMWLEQYRWERKHLLELTKTAISVGIEERRVKLAEAQGSLMNDVIRRILARLSLTPDQSALLPVVVPEELRRAAAMASAN